jgi:glycosyltransferase involved in cell wall biosynthesis
MEKKISIKYFYNFKEDNRKSMQTVSDYLYNNVKNDKNFKVSRFIPKFDSKFSKFSSFAWGLRYNRYVKYQNQVKKLKKVDVAHIVDHQYSHLVHKINANKKIVTVHDLIPIKFKKKIGKNPYLVKFSLNHLKYFDEVIAVSENTKKDILKYTDCPKKKIKVLHSSVEKSFNNKNIDKKKVCAAYHIPYQSKKILIVGSSFYKNHRISLKILEQLKKTYKNKVILLKIGNKLDFKIKKELKTNIFEFNHIKRNKIHEIYKVADLLLFPSIYEGYGLPCVEAMNSKLPIVASHVSSIKEILGNYPLLFKPNDYKRMIKSIIALIEDKKFRNQIKKYLFSRARLFKETNYFNKLKNIYLN